MKKEKKSPIEMLLDQNNDENIKLYDSANKLTEFEQIAIIPMDEKIYAILAPVTKIAGVNDGEGMVFSIEEIEGEECLVEADDEKIIDKIFDEYEKMMKEAGFDEKSGGTNTGSTKAGSGKKTGSKK